MNLITVHDGFTLRDLVSYDSKHNEANGQDNQDGTDDNHSWNCGVEGPTDDPVVLALRARQSRAMLATLLLSFGIPMLAGGDEIGRTQQGNNNAYCQDNEISWFDWSQQDGSLGDFTKKLIALRRTHPVFRRSRFLAGVQASELRWFTFAGTGMTADGWNDQSALSIALYLDGSDDPDEAADGTWLVDDDFLVLVNAWWEPLEFTLPATREQAAWNTEIDTYDLAGPAGVTAGPAGAVAGPAGVRRAGERLTVGPRSVVVLEARARSDSGVRGGRDRGVDGGVHRCPDRLVADRGGFGDRVGYADGAYHGRGRAGSGRVALGGLQQSLARGSAGPAGKDDTGHVDRASQSGQCRLRRFQGLRGRGHGRQPVARLRRPGGVQDRPPGYRDAEYPAPIRADGPGGCCPGKVPLDESPAIARDPGSRGRPVPPAGHACQGLIQQRVTGRRGIADDDPAAHDIDAASGGKPDKLGTARPNRSLAGMGSLLPERAASSSRSSPSSSMATMVT